MVIWIAKFWKQSAEAAARMTHFGKHLPSLEVLQEHLLGVNQLLLGEGAADILESLLFSQAAKLDILIQMRPVTQDTAQVSLGRDAHHLESQ